MAGTGGADRRIAFPAMETPESASQQISLVDPAHMHLPKLLSLALGGGIILPDLIQ